MSERREHLDLLADHILAKMDSLCGRAVREAFRHEVFKACKIEPTSVDENGKGRYEWAKHLYADGLLDDVFSHMADRWGRFRETDRRLCSAATATFDDEGEFEP